MTEALLALFVFVFVFVFALSQPGTDLHHAGAALTDPAGELAAGEALLVAEVVEKGF